MPNGTPQQWQDRADRIRTGMTAEWAKSPWSASGNCVEARLMDGNVEVRDTKANGEGPTLSFTPSEWEAFTQGVRGGAFDVA